MPLAMSSHGSADLRVAQLPGAAATTIATTRAVVDPADRLHGRETAAAVAKIIAMAETPTMVVDRAAITELRHRQPPPELPHGTRLLLPLPALVATVAIPVQLLTSLVTARLRGCLHRLRAELLLRVLLLEAYQH
jgi:hypothetical protein